MSETIHDVGGTDQTEPTVRLGNSADIVLFPPADSWKAPLLSTAGRCPNRMATVIVWS